jgi:hypothetical protein
MGFRKIQWEALGQVQPWQDVVLKLADHWGASLADGFYYVVIKAQGQQWIAKLLILR